MVLDDGLPTATSHDQAELERRVLHIYTTAYADGRRGAGLPTRCHRVAAAAAASGMVRPAVTKDAMVPGIPTLPLPMSQGLIHKTQTWR